MLERPFELVMDKQAEAKFFLEKMKAEGFNIFEFRCYYSAFISASRSITFALQAVMKMIPGFKEWYAIWQEELSSNKTARFFVTSRNETLKTGETRINAATGGISEDGTMVVKYYFAKTGPLDPFEPIDSDVVSASEEYLKLLDTLIEDCRKIFEKEIDPDRLFTSEFLIERGWGVEDIEEMIGFPRGWTKGIPEDERLRVLKDGTSPNMVESIGKKILSIESQAQENVNSSQEEDDQE